MRFYSETIIKLRNADCHLHYANNKGRGKDNVTVTFVEPGTERPGLTRYYEEIDDVVIKQYRTSGWKGSVNIPTADINYFGGFSHDSNCRVLS